MYDADVVVIGGGGREHAIAHACHHEGASVVVSGGNDGIPWATPEPPEELDAGLFIIGSEEPLVAGLADKLRAQGKRVYGPGATGALLEGSKLWMKEVAEAADVPTAPYKAFRDLEAAQRYLRGCDAPFVIKANGLAAGKGVLVTGDIDEALADAEAKLSGRAFGPAGQLIIIEEALVGQEITVMAMCNGNDVWILQPARDYKRLLPGDEGPNTGGMGSRSPVVWDLDYMALRQTFFQPIVDELRRRGIDFRGTLYAGLMLTANGPYLLEINVRFGDPEMQATAPRILKGFVDCLTSAATGRNMVGPVFSPEHCVVIALCSEGYPTNPLTGRVITGIEEAEQYALVFAAGVKRGRRSELRTNGGRVLYVAGRGADMAEARAQAMMAAIALLVIGYISKSYLILLA